MNRLLPFRAGNDAGTVGQAIDCAIRFCQRQLDLKRVQLVTDLSAADSVDCPEVLRTAIINTVDDAVARSDADEVIWIMTVVTARGLEIEIADSTQAPLQSRLCAFSTRCTTAAEDASESFQSFRARCPQGGTATTFLLPTRLAQRMTA